MGPDAASRATVPGYAGRPVTKAPNWHGLVTLDILFNNLSTGLFLVIAAGELVQPASFRPLAPVAYPIALLFLIADLVCLVLDLGDPSRFHHMLRVWKPSSPMSLGTWLLTAYAVPVTLVSGIGLLPTSGGLEVARRLLLVVGLVLAVGAAVYKGVLFSTTAQRGWGDARWLGGYLINSALVLGAAEGLLLGMVMGQPRVVNVLRLALQLLLVLNLIALGLLLADIHNPLTQARGPRALAVAGMLAVLGGILVPLGLLALEAPLPLALAVLLILLGAVIVRNEIVRLPHFLRAASQGG
ncbi:MAG TPA: NrfD/PsrC family molybdoenzyme membrane anchor subunit [Gemmatimonadales bacterium]|nr:NrfD/PsrC family molybdoenzyme membrane anchor subunit [Gemmatimonadales bacterium]